jgi:acyl carrier protein
MAEVIATGSVTEVATAEKVRAIAYSVLRVDPAQVRISAESNLYDLGLESLNVVELLSGLEADYDITIDVEDLSEGLFNRFGTLVEFVQRKIREKSVA